MSDDDSLFSILCQLRGVAAILISLACDVMQ